MTCTRCGPWRLTAGEDGPVWVCATCGDQTPSPLVALLGGGRAGRQETGARVEGTDGAAEPKRPPLPASGDQERPPGDGESQYGDGPTRKPGNGGRRGRARRWVGRVAWCAAFCAVWVTGWVVSALALPAGVPDASADEDAALITCPQQDYPWSPPTSAICERNYQDFCIEDGDVCLILQYQGTPGLAHPAWYATVGGSYFLTDNWAICTFLGDRYDVQWREGSQWTPSQYGTSGFQAVNPAAGFAEGATGYIFGEDNPASGEFAALFDAMWNLPTDANIQAYCGALDSGAEPPAEATLIVYLPVGAIEEEDIVTLVLGNVEPGTDVSCAAPGTVAGVPSEGQTTEGGTFTFEMQWADSGSYGVTCSWEPDGEARVLVTVGSGLDDVLSDWGDTADCDCGAWYHFTCHMGCALRWAFVPDADALYEMWDGLEAGTMDHWPLGPLLWGVDWMGEVMVDAGHGINDPLYYWAGECPGSAAEVCEYGFMIGEAWSGTPSYGGNSEQPLWDVIPLAGGSEGGGLDLPAFRIMGAPEAGSSLAQWAEIIRALLTGAIVVGLVSSVIGLAVWIMKLSPPPGTGGANSPDWDATHDSEGNPI